MTVGAHIFNHSFKELLRDKTRVIVLSSHLHLLEHFDQIIVVEQSQWQNNAAAIKKPNNMSSSRSNISGHIVSTGTFAELQGRFASLMSQRTEAELEEERSAVTVDEFVKPGEQAQESKFNFNEALPASSDRNNRKGVDRAAAAGSVANHATAAAAAKQLAATKAKELMHNAPKDASVLIEKEDRSQGAVGWDVWIQYFSSGEKSWSGLALLVSETNNGLGLSLIHI